jgi:hypothetical protein
MDRRTAVAGDAPGSTYSLSTSDDERAIALARDVGGVTAAWRGGAAGIRLTATPDVLDAYAIALGRQGLAVRRLELLVSPLQSLFFALTAADQPEPEPTRS